MAIPDLSLECVAERDIDLLLVEELSVCDDFARWLAAQAGFEPPVEAAPARAFHSVSDASLGESDIVVVWPLGTEGAHALLIENKIDAPAQPDQGARYRQRGELGIIEGDWSAFRTSLVAPRRYLAASRDAAHYDGEVSYEAIRDWLLERPFETARYRYRAAVVDAAIEQQRRGYSPKIDDHVTDFWRSFWLESLEYGPRLGMSEPGPKPAGSGWIWVRPPELGGRRYLGFKLLQGFVDLQIDGAASHSERIDELCQARLPGGVRAIQTTKSTSLRLEADVVDILSEFAPQRDAIHSVFEAANTLLDAWKVVAADIEAIVAEE